MKIKKYEGTSDYIASKRVLILASFNGIIASMRTTITLDTDIAHKLGQRIRQSRKPAKQVYNDLLRSALAEKRRAKKRQPFHLLVFKGKKGLMPGFSWEMSTSQIMDRLDEDEFGRKK